MNRGVDRQAVFFGDADRAEFGRALAEVHDRFEVETIAYCLMGNHYHLLLRAPGDQLSKAMHHLGTTYTARTNRRRARDGPLFRGRFHSIPVETDTYFMWAAAYIHRNPLDLPGVRRPADYRWSSYRTYLGLRHRPEFVNTDLLLGFFGHDPARLAGFTEQAPTIDLTSGDVIADLLQLLEFEIGRDDLSYGADPSPSAWQSRTVLLVLMDRFRGHPVGSAIEAHLALASSRSLERAVERALTRARHEPAIARIAAAISEHVSPRRAA